MAKYSIGLDFGTNSCRSLIVNIKNGEEIASHVFNYPSGEAGIIVDPKNPNLARQNPADYIEGIQVTINEAVKKVEHILTETREIFDFFNSLFNFNNSDNKSYIS